MSQQIRFFYKSRLDISNDVVTLTASQGNDFVNFIRNRSNRTAWATTGSVDADNTYIEVNFVDLVSIDSILLIKHNFKSYTLQYYNGSTYVDFSTAINVSNNSDATTFHQFTQVFTTKIKLIITGTMVADSDKYLFQMLACDSIGQLNGWPIIKSPKVSRNRIISKLISGRVNIKEQIETFSCELQIKVTSDDSDLSIIEALYAMNSGFHVWLSGGDDSQFSSRRIGYRKEDIVLMKCQDELEPEWYKGFYTSGQVVKIKLIEVSN